MLNGSEMMINVLVEEHDEGWFFVTSEDFPGLALSGPDLEEIFAELPHAITALLKVQYREVARKSVAGKLAEAKSENNWKNVQTTIPAPHVIAAA